MKIVFNSFYKNSVATISYSNALRGIKCITFYDIENYQKYSHALFMSYPKDLEELKKAKSMNPSIIIGIIDPRGNEISQYLDYFDFIIVDSIEMRDFFLKFDKPIFEYYEYPSFASKPKYHFQKDKIIIGYHGNKLHLDSMYPNLYFALEKLSEKYQLELRLIYNIKHLGKATFGIPKGIKTQHIQWYENVYLNELSEVDIGICPNLMPVPINANKKISINKYFNEADEDYILRFKMPSNPGRCIVFGRLGIPVVVDFTPSHLQIIEHGINGFIAHSSSGWYDSLAKYIESPEIRNVHSNNFFKIIKNKYDFNFQNQNLIDFIEKIQDKPKKLIFKKKISKFKMFIMNNFSLFEKIKKLI